MSPCLCFTPTGKPCFNQIQTISNDKIYGNTITSTDLRIIYKQGEGVCENKGVRHRGGMRFLHFHWLLRWKYSAGKKKRREIIIHMAIICIAAYCSVLLCHSTRKHYFMVSRFVVNLCFPPCRSCYFVKFVLQNYLNLSQVIVCGLDCFSHTRLTIYLINLFLHL